VKSSSCIVQFVQTVVGIVSFCAFGAGCSGDGKCADVVATGSPGLVDDLNHVGAAIPRNDGRHGQWATWGDGTGTQTPAGAPPNVCQATSFVPTNGQACTSGSGFTTWGAAIGVTVAEGEQDCVICNYDATAYTGGVRFTISGSVTGSLRFMVETAEVDETRWGGTCTAGTKCWDAYGMVVGVTPQPQVIDVPWTSLRQQGWGIPVLFDIRHIQQLVWEVQKNGMAPVSFANLCIDDVAFY